MLFEARWVKSVKVFTIWVCDAAVLTHLQSSPSDPATLRSFTLSFAAHAKRAY